MSVYNNMFDNPTDVAAIPTLLAQHFAELGAIIEQLERLAHNAELQFESLTALESRACDHLDALRIAGDTAIRIGQSAINDDGEIALVVILLLTEADLASGRSEWAVSLLHNESQEIREAA